jgi:MFS family permease
MADGVMADGKVAKGAWWMLGVLWLLYSLSFLDRFIITMLVDPIRADLGLSDFQMSLILGPAYAICYAFATFPFGWAADRFPRRLVAFAGVIFWSLATAGSGLAVSFGGLLIARICVGLGEAALSPTAYSMIGDRFPRQRLTTASAIFQTAIKAGSAAAFGIGGLLLTIATQMSASGEGWLGHVAPWRPVMLMVGLPGLLFGLLLFTFPEPKRILSPRETSEGSPPLWPFVVAHRQVLIPLALGFAFTSLGATALASWTPTYVGRRFGWSPLHYGAMLSVLNIAAAAALVLKGGIVDWLFKRGLKDAHIRFYCWLLAASLPVALTLFFVGNPYVFFGMYAFLLLVMISFGAYGTAAMAVLAPSQLRGRLTALLLLIINLAGSGLGATVVGALTDFVFRDKDKIGMSLAVTISFALPCALIALWSSLAPWRRALARNESPPVPAAA